MRATPPILISLAAFGADAVRRHGQRHFAEIARAAGADGVEVRGELLAAGGDGPDGGGDGELEALRATGTVRVYSSPEGLWDGDGALDAAALQRAFDRAARLGAARCKFSIGGWRPGPAAGLRDLRDRLAGSAVELVVENDQTPAAGTLGALRRFFAAADAAGLALPMTFDLGNWHWQGECPLQAAIALGPRVGYVHAKGVQRLPGKWVAVPLEDSAAPWRAVLRALPADAPRAIEYPLAGDDLDAIVRREIGVLRAAAALQQDSPP
jgi:sugar phosphate isomerase/epimerase